MKSPNLAECAEKCVEAFNNLTGFDIDGICKKIISCVREGGIIEEFELPALDILNYCWFTILYVNMLRKEDWGEVIGFVVKNNKVVYVGIDYLDYMRDEE